ncbi:unnamed protein product [Miscanthus lutarioriparius]|uniref:Retrovirus-related Pol polyprotein from transposon TNT 1-94 n=1 Tax=Miscanthus lutarioriparius TaxID=422564 RepID=A0A811RPE0_9POAL|nr:unnamed protein product [Miscanthus lutarioriparius]
MAKNLISLSTLDAEGYKHSSSGGVCKVSKGSLIHMIGDMNSAKLYVLRGSTLHGSVTAATVSNDEPSKTNLWHMRLGHMSELGMTELFKRDLLDGCIVGQMKFCEHCVFDVSPVGFDEEQQHVSVHVEHVDDRETKIVDNNVHDIVQHSRPVLQPQNQSIADRRTKRNYGPRPRLIEECDMVHYAFSCAKQVENIHEPATYTEAVVSGDREKWIFAMQEEMQSLEKNSIWDVSKKEITTLKKLLSSEFGMKDLGAAKKILGMEITRDRNSSLLFLSQQSYIKKVLHRFNMHDAKSVSTPIAPHFKLSTLQCASTDEDFEYMSRVSYSSTVGSLMYAMVCSRPDLSYAISLVSRYMTNPSKEHWKTVQ